MRLKTRNPTFFDICDVQEVRPPSGALPGASDARSPIPEPAPVESRTPAAPDPEPEDGGEAGRSASSSEVRRWIRGGSPYDGIDQPRFLRRLLRTAPPEAVPRLRARLLISEAYVEATKGGHVKDFCSDRARALLSMWGNLATDPGTFEVTRYASDVLERVRACLHGDVAQGVAPCECGAPKPRGRRYCDRCRDRRLRESNRERSRRRRAKTDGRVTS